MRTTSTVNHHLLRFGLAVIAASGLMIATQAGAEDTTGAPIEESFGAVKTRLNLTPDQEAKLAPLMKDDAVQMRTIMERYRTTPSPEQREQKFEELREERRTFREKLAGVLTQEQLMEWDRMRADALTRAQKERLGGN